jgi:hypothetical protein
MKRECTEGAICAWEYKGALYRSVEERIAAEKKHKYNTAVRALASYLEAPRTQIFSNKVSRDFTSIQCEYRTHPPFFIKQSMQPYEVAEKLVEEWSEIRDHIDSIMEYTK